MGINETLIGFFSGSFQGLCQAAELTSSFLTFIKNN